MLLPDFATPLDAYKFAIDKVVEQGKPSIGANGKCAYRASERRNGKVRCAVGFLIPDEMYDRSFEGDSVEALEGMQSYFENQGYSGIILGELQIAHDQSWSSKPFVPTFLKAVINNFRKVDSMENAIRQYAAEKLNELTKN